MTYNPRMRIRRSRILAALLSLLVAFHWLPGALASSSSPFPGAICGGQHAALHDGAFQPAGGDDGCKHECKLCSGTGVSAPAIVPTVAPSASTACVGIAFTSPDLTSSLWAPVWARPPPRG